MNRELKEIFASMQSKFAEIKACEDPEKAKTLMDEYKELKKKYDMKKEAYETEKEMAVLKAAQNPMPMPDSIDTVKTVAEDKKAKTAEEVGALVVKQVKELIQPSGKADKDLSETVDADGGYVVPVDAQTQINQYKRANCSFLDEISVETVSTKKGTRVYQTKGSPAAFRKLTEDGMLAEDDSTDTSKKSNMVASPKFEQKSFGIQDYAGFMPVPNNLIADSDANILNVVYKWLAEAETATDNAEILGLLGAAEMGSGWDAIDGLDGLKKAVNVTLGQAYAGSMKIHTNDDGLQYLDTLKDKNDRPLLNPVPNEPGKMQLTIGFRTIPVSVKPNAYFASQKATTTAGGKIPMIIGDMKEAIRKYDRQQLVLAASNVAAIGGINAFAQNLTMIRGIMRADYKLIDANAIVKGYIATPKATA